MKRILLFLTTLLCSFPLFAVDDPTVEEGEVKYDQRMCITQFTNDCVNSNCLTSEDRDCTDRCKANAEDKCEAEIIGE